MSGAVGSRPSFDAQLAALARGRLELALEPARGQATSAALRVRKAASAGGRRPSGPMLVSAPSRRPCRRLAATALRGPPRRAPRRMSDANGSQHHAAVRRPRAAGATARAAARQEAAGCSPILAAARAAGDRLDGLRDDDGGRVRPAGPREPQGVPGRAQLGPRRRPAASRLGVLTNNQSRVLVALRATSRPTCATRSSRSRTGASTELAASTSAASAARSSQDVVQQRAAQGGSTITQQFVKNALRAQSDRTVFQKLREAALAYHLTRKWSKEQDPHRVPELDLLRQRRLRRSSRRRGPTSATSPTTRTAARAASLCVKRAASPTRRRCSPASSPTRAATTRSPTRRRPRARRNLVLKEMFEQGLHHARASTSTRASRRCRRRSTSSRRPCGPRRPYFTTWVRQQLVDRFGARTRVRGRAEGHDDARPRPPEGGRAGGQQLPRQRRRARRPRVVAIDNKTGEVRAMVGGRDYAHAAVQPRHPGPAPAGLGDQAVHPRLGAEGGHRRRARCGRRASASSPSPARSGSEKFVVNNFESKYAGSQTLAGGLTYSDNSVFSAVGISVGTKKIARAGRAHGHPHAGLVELRDDARRPASRASRRSTWPTPTRPSSSGGRRIGGTLGAERRRPGRDRRGRLAERQGAQAEPRRRASRVLEPRHRRPDASGS